MTQGIGPNTAIGAEFRGATKILKEERLLMFSGGPLSRENWPRSNLHTSLEKATAAGLSAPIVSGTQLQGHVIELLLSLFGPDWLTHGTMDVRFIRPVYANEAMQAVAVVTGRDEDPDGITFGLDVRSTPLDGKDGLTGKATGYLVYSRDHDQES